MQPAMTFVRRRANASAACPDSRAPEMTPVVAEEKPPERGDDRQPAYEPVAPREDRPQEIHAARLTRAVPAATPPSCELMSADAWRG